MTFARIIKQLEKRRDAVGKERDKLGNLIAELDGLRDSCNRAYDDMQHAIDALSEHA